LTVIVSLACGDWTAEIAPAGGAIVSLARRDAPILRPTTEAARRAGEVRHMACYPMVPYANRIGDGRFGFGGVEHQLAANFARSPHPLHGVGWRRAWRIEACDEQACSLVLEHRPLGYGPATWPFAFDARQRFALDAAGLTVTISMTNAGDTDAPAGIGLHPFFPHRTGQRLAFASRGAWLTGADMLPKDRVTGGDWDFGAGQALGAAALDNDFHGWDGMAAMTADEGPRVIMRASPAFGVLRVYTPKGADFFAAEPVSHRADAINHPADLDGAMTVLASGATLEGEVRFTVETA
jgi:aldose 1-epimerase